MYQSHADMLPIPTQLCACILVLAVSGVCVCAVYTTVYYHYSLHLHIQTSNSDIFRMFDVRLPRLQSSFHRNIQRYLLLPLLMCTVLLLQKLLFRVYHGKIPIYLPTYRGGRGYKGISKLLWAGQVPTLFDLLLRNGRSAVLLPEHYFL